VTSDRRNQRNPAMEPGDEPLDPDIVLITDYLGHELSPAKEAEVETRLVADEEFYEKVVPYLRLWTAPVDYRKELAEYEAEARSASGASLAAAAHAPLPSAIDLPSERTLRAARRRGLFSRGRVVFGIAAALLLMVGGRAVYHLGFSSGREEAARAAAQEQAARAAAEAARAAQEEAARRAARGGGASVPAVRAARTVRLADSSLVHLTAGSRLYKGDSIASWPAVAELEGEAVIEVSRRAGMLWLWTSVGWLDLTPGTYAVRCDAGGNEMLVTVGHGEATLHGDSPDPTVTIRAGEHGRLLKGKPPQRTQGGDGYPSLVPPGSTRP